MALRFSLYYAAVFLAVGIYAPFWPAWLGHRGLDAGEIGLVASAAIWTRALGTPVIAHFADRTGAYRRIIAVSAAGGACAYAALGLADGFWPLLAGNLVAGSLFMALIPLGESLASRSAGPRRFDYGRVRLWGSITFILAAYLGGAAIERGGDAVTLYIMIAALCLSLAAGARLPERRRAAAVATRLPALALLGDRRFLVFILAVSLLQSSHALLYLFATIHWREAGIGNAVIGALWAEGVIAEIALFAFSGAVVARLGPARLMLLAAAAGVLRWTALAETTDVLALACVQWLHGLTFGAAHLAAMHHMLRTVPEHMSASAQSLYSGFAIGLAMGLAMLAGGWLFEAEGGAAFRAMAVLSAAGGVAALWLGRLSRQPSSSARSQAVRTR